MKSEVYTFRAENCPRAESKSMWKLFREKYYPETLDHLKKKWTKENKKVNLYRDNCTKNPNLSFFCRK